MRYPGSIDTITLKTQDRPMLAPDIKIIWDGIDRNGQHIIVGFIDGLKITIRETGTFITGSLSRYLIGSNCHSLSLSDNKEAIQKLSDALMIDMGKAQVTCLDYAQNIFTDLPPSIYFSLLGHSSQLTVRGTFHKKTETLYYKNGTTKNQINGNLELILYDKVDEAGFKNVPDDWNGLNVMRVELSLFNRPEKQLKAELTGFSLSDPDTMQKVCNRYLSAFDSIYTVNSIRLNTKPINGIKKLFDQFTGLGIQAFGLDNALLAVNELKASGAFKHREYYSEAKRLIKRFHSNNDITDAAPLIDELTQKVHSVYNKL
jgi:hypothetical protein